MFNPVKIINIRKSKNTSSIRAFSLPDPWLAHIHIDFIQPSEGYTYCMTITDCFTRWLEAILTIDITVETTCTDLIHQWISCFHWPVTITMDQGRNFESHLFKHLTNILHTNRTWTISYYPQSNELVEWFHSHLKGLIITYNHPKLDWNSSNSFTWNLLCH